MHGPNPEQATSAKTGIPAAIKEVATPADTAAKAG